MRNLVVGVDGTAVAREALAWAAETVGTEGEVHVVAAVSPRTEMRSPEFTKGSAKYLQVLQHTLDSSWVAPIHDLVQTITARADSGNASDALVAEAREKHADAIVVGAHVPALGRPRTVGLTIRRLLRDLPCPLIVVPGRNHRRLGDGDPVIVGVGHGPATEAAVRWAAATAESHGLPLGLVRVTGEGPVFQVDGLLDLVAFYIDPGKRLEWAREDVADLARLAQQATHDEITVAASAIPGLPATQLAQASASASMLVIGRHQPLLDGRHHVAQPLRFELTHARCPVAVVPVPTSERLADPES